MKDQIELAKLEAKREKEYQDLKSKIEKEFPVRQKLAKLLGRNPDDNSIHDLFIEIVIHEPEQADAAREIIKCLK